MAVVPCRACERQQREQVPKGGSSGKKDAHKASYYPHLFVGTVARPRQTFIPLFDSPSFDPGESVGAPVLAAHPVVEEEEAVGVVFLLDALKARIVVAPEGVLPVRLEVVRLPDK